MRRSWFVAALFGLVVVAAPGRSDEAKDPKAVIEKAVQATGGLANFEKYKAASMKAKGTIHVQGMTIEFTGNFVQQPPKLAKATMEADIGGQKIEIVQVFNGDKGWMKVMGNTMELEKDRIDEAKEQHFGEWVGRLAPILKHKGFTLSPLGEVKVDGKDAVGVKVAHKDHRDIDLFFDTKTGLLLKSQSRVKDETGQEVNQESFYHKYKEFEGVKVPTKMVIKRDGKDFLDMEISDYKPMEKVDESEFAMP